MEKTRKKACISSKVNTALAYSCQVLGMSPLTENDRIQLCAQIVSGAGLNEVVVDPTCTQSSIFSLVFNTLYKDESLRKMIGRGEHPDYYTKMLHELTDLISDKVYLALFHEDISLVSSEAETRTAWLHLRQLQQSSLGGHYFL